MKSLLKAFVLTLVLVITSCKQDRTNKPNKVGDQKPKIKIKGSESELNLVKYLADQFTYKYEDVAVEVAGGGSGVGIEALFQHRVQIANSSRLLSEIELEAASQKGIVPIPVIIATDAVGIISNSANPVDSLSLIELGDIFSGRTNNWKQVGGPDLPITVVCRDENSGTHHYVLSRLMISEYAGSATVLSENTEVIKKVKATKGGIGYVNLGSLIDNSGLPIRDIWTISPYFEGGKAHSPFETEAVRCGDYPLIRPLYQYIIGYPTARVLDFLQFETSVEVQKKLEHHGYFPITEMHRIINSRNVKGL